MVEESCEKVARRWASCGEAAMRKRGGGYARVEGPDRVGEEESISGEILAVKIQYEACHKLFAGIHTVLITT